MIVGSALEAPAVIAGFNDVAMVGQAIEQGGGHLGVAEHTWPFAESEVSGDDDRGTLVEPADEVEQELAARLSERQIPAYTIPTRDASCSMAATCVNTILTPCAGTWG